MPHDIAPLASGALVPFSIASDLDLAHELVREELSESTRSGYRRDVRLFTHWCDARGVSPLPAASTTVAAYIGSLVGEGRVRAGTLSRRLAAIGWAHKIAGEEDPTEGDAVRSALRGARRRLGTAPIHRKAAITPDMLVTMLELCPATLAGKRDRALLSLGWALALRRSELVALTVDNLEWVPGGLHVRIARSKTDQESVGVRLGLPDRARDRIRPAKELRTWLRAAKIKSGPVFVRVNKAGRTQAQLDGGTIGQLVKRYAGLAGFDVDSLGGHSLRTGFVTSAASTGASVATLANVTRHSSADVLLGYVRTANLVADYPSEILR